MIALFPGQGSQHVGMAKDLYDNFRIVRDVFEEASDSAKLNLKKLCFDGPESELVLTENTQPCLLATSVAAFRAAQSETGFAPTAVAGHSLGEYSALVCAGALPLGAAARWVRERGAAMQQAVPAGQGGMAAILGLEDSAVEKLCVRATDLAREARSAGEHSDLSVDPLVQPANYNAPGQLVVAGSRDGVEKAVQLAKGGDFGPGKAMILPVSAPFHSHLMGRARSRMAELFAQASESERPKALACPYVPNRTATLTAEPGLVLELLVEQVDNPVLWKQSIHALISAGHTNAVEFGPGKVLAGLAKRIGAPAGFETVGAMKVNGCGDSTGVRTLDSLLKGGPQA